MRKRERRTDWCFICCEKACKTQKDKRQKIEKKTPASIPKNKQQTKKGTKGTATFKLYTYYKTFNRMMNNDLRNTKVTLISWTLLTYDKVIVVI